MNNAKKATQLSIPSGSTLIESHRGIASSQASTIAEHYRRLGGYQVVLNEQGFRSDINVFSLAPPAIEARYRSVNE